MANDYTVQQLARLAGVSVRTLHHYDRIGLLLPARIGANGYRYYRELELLRLQQILLYRAFGLPLRRIAALLARDGAGRVATLEAQRAALVEQAARCQVLLATIDRTIRALTGDHRMDHQELYRGLAPHELRRYRAQAIRRHGREAVAQADALWAGLDETARADRLAGLATIEAGLAAACRDGVPADAADLAALLERHRAWIAAMWDRACPAAAYAGLAHTYRETPAFRVRFDTLAPGLADYLPAAMAAHARRLG